MRCISTPRPTRTTFPRGSCREPPRDGRPNQRPAAADRQGRGIERAYQYLTESLQTLGGSGYLDDYPIEQYIRDAKIDSLYEGTTGIQAQDLVFRKIIRDQRRALDHVLSQIRKYTESDAVHPSLRDGVALLATALGDVDAIVGTFTDLYTRSSSEPRLLYRIGLQSVPFLLGLADLLIGWLLLRQGDIALRTLDQQAAVRDEPFYRGKIAVATFFAVTVLPQLTALRRTAESRRSRDHGARRRRALRRQSVVMAVKSSLTS